MVHQTSSVWTIPGTVNAGGLNNTRFVSDLALTNPGTVPAQATISFIPANGTTPKQVTLNAGETVVYRNVLDRLWGAQGAGATQVASDSPLLIRARTYNTAVSGTYGVALPVFADDRLLAPGKAAHSLWVGQSADGTSGYRTNVAVVFPDEGGGAEHGATFCRGEARAHVAEVPPHLHLQHDPLSAREGGDRCGGEERRGRGPRDRLYDGDCHGERCRPVIEAMLREAGI